MMKKKSKEELEREEEIQRTGKEGLRNFQLRKTKQGFSSKYLQFTFLK